MPRELQAASSLPSREQWGHCGRPGKCGQIPGTGSFPLGGSFLPRTLLLHSGRSAAGCQPFPRGLEENRAGSATGTPCQRTRWPCRATSLLPICLGTKCSQTATGAKLPATAAEQAASRLPRTASSAPGSAAGSAALPGCATGRGGGLEQKESVSSHPKATFQWWVQALTWDQEPLGNLRTPQVDRPYRGDEGTTGTAFPASAV